MANFKDKSDECFNEPRYNCLCEAFHDFGVSIPTMSGKMAKAVMDDFFELLEGKRRSSEWKGGPKEFPYVAIVEFQEYGRNCIENVAVVASSEHETYKKVMEEYEDEDKDLVDCKVVRLPDYMLNNVKDQIRARKDFYRWEI